METRTAIIAAAPSGPHETYHLSCLKCHSCSQLLSRDGEKVICAREDGFLVHAECRRPADIR
jgi:hypothetical protein